jgi:hypothetical protein
MPAVKLSYRIALVGTAILFIVGGFLVYIVASNLSATGSDLTREEQQVRGVPRMIDGILVDSDKTDLPLVAVMIENHPDARPQAGLAQAKLVYEVLAEGAITRMLAVYDLTENLEHIGPVRSARPYYIDIAREFNALYAHSGGSPDALDRLRVEKDIIDLNEFFARNSKYFWRRAGFYAPHNLYTSSARLVDAATEYQLATSTVSSWQFKDDIASDQRSASSTDIMIDYSKNLLSRVEWKYNPASNDYTRWQSGEVHYDENGAALTAKNVVVQVVATKVLDEVGRKKMDLIGSGKATVFQDGQVIVGKWERPSLNSRTRYYNENGPEIAFNRGQTWVQLVPEWVEYEY